MTVRTPNGNTLLARGGVHAERCAINCACCKCALFALIAPPHTPHTHPTHTPSLGLKLEFCIRCHCYSDLPGISCVHLNVTLLSGTLNAAFGISLLFPHPHRESYFCLSLHLETPRHVFRCHLTTFTVLRC